MARDRRQHGGVRAGLRPAAWAFLVSALVLAGALWGRRALPVEGVGSTWLARGMTSRPFVLAAALAVASAAALPLIGGAVWHAARRERQRRRASREHAESGTAMVEFAMVLPIALFIVLVMAQSTMLMTGVVCVHRSAYEAARTAIVTIPDGLRQVDLAAPPDPEGHNMMQEFHFSVMHGGSPKGQRIWRAAVVANMPVSSSSPDMPEADAGSLVAGLEGFFSAYARNTPSWVHRYLGRKLQYAQEYTAVDLRPPAAGDKYGENEDVTVRVEHTLYLSVPYVNRLFANLVDDGVELNFGAGEYGVVVRAACTLTNEGVQDFVEEEEPPPPD